MEGENIIQGTNNPLNVINVRCPSCFKLYAVNESDLNVRKPRFACNKCDQQFWISYPECKGVAEILGYPWVATMNEEVQKINSPQKIDSSQKIDSPQKMEQEKEDLPPRLSNSIESQIKFKLNEKFTEKSVEESVVEEPLKACPKCEHKNPESSDECRSCGVLMARFEKIQSEPMLAKIPQSKKLMSAWQNVMNDYDQPKIHQKFIDLCTQLKMLNYAIHKYDQILKIDSGNPIAIQRKGQIYALLMNQVDFVREPKSRKVKKRFRWTFIMMSLGLAMIVIGYFIPQFRNMIGVGVAMAFLTMALRVTFR